VPAEKGFLRALPSRAPDPGPPVSGGTPFRRSMLLPLPKCFAPDLAACYPTLAREASRVFREQNTPEIRNTKTNQRRPELIWFTPLVLAQGGEIEAERGNQSCISISKRSPAL
jgi:hypothetical protein